MTDLEKLISNRANKVINFQSAFDLAEKIKSGLITKKAAILKLSKLRHEFEFFENLYIEFGLDEEKEIHKDDYDYLSKLGLHIIKHDFRNLCTQACLVNEFIESGLIDKNWGELENFVAGEDKFNLYENVRTGLAMVGYIATGMDKFLFNINTNRIPRLIDNFCNSSIEVEYDFSNITQIKSDEYFAIYQLIKNAHRFQKKKSPIKVMFRESSYQILITVSDNGCGIQRETLPHVFSNYTNGGTGKGLQLVNRIVELRENKLGYIEVISKTDTGEANFYSTQNNSLETGSKTSVGTTFTLFLPKKYNHNHDNSLH